MSVVFTLSASASAPSPSLPNWFSVCACDLLLLLVLCSDLVDVPLTGKVQQCERCVDLQCFAQCTHCFATKGRGCLFEPTSCGFESAFTNGCLVGWWCSQLRSSSISVVLDLSALHSARVLASAFFPVLVASPCTSERMAWWLSVGSLYALTLLYDAGLSGWT